MRYAAMISDLTPRPFGARCPTNGSLFQELLEILEHSAEIRKLQSFFLSLVFELVQRADRRNACPRVHLIWLSDDVIEFRD